VQVQQRWWCSGGAELGVLVQRCSRGGQEMVQVQEVQQRCRVGTEVVQGCGVGAESRV